MYTSSFAKQAAVSLSAALTMAACDGGNSSDSGDSPPVTSEKIVVAWTMDSGAGRIRAMSTKSPWQFDGPEVVTGGDVTLHCGGGRLFALSRSEGTVSIVDLSIQQVLPVASLEPGDPVDIAVTGPDIAYLTRRSATHLLRLDVDTGATTDVVDLSSFADNDGIPDLGSMAVHGGRLFVQIRRFNDALPFGYSPPAYIAVIDIESEQLVDTEPGIPGVQAIELLGTAPKYKMQVLPQRMDPVPTTADLFVSASGAMHDMGGLEIVDLGTLRSRGLAISEAFDDVGADIGPFVMVTADEGFLVSTTDLIASSHLQRFTVDGGMDPPPDLAQSIGYYAPAIVLDSDQNTLYFPIGNADESGIKVLDVASGIPLMPGLTKTDGKPTDLLPECPKP